MQNFIISIDRSLFLFFNNTIANPVFDIIFPFITEENNWLIPGIIILIIFVIIKKKKAIPVIILIIITFALTDSISYRVLKPLFGRLRPCNPDLYIEGGRFLFGYKTTLAFPSNHAANIFGLATILSYFYCKRYYYFYGFAFIIGFSRIYVGVHYPLDIFEGAVVGIIIASGVYYSYTRIIFLIRRRKGKEIIKSESNDF